jgi:hypothetical protein
MGMHGLNSALNGLRMSISKLVLLFAWCPSFSTELSLQIYSFSRDRRRQPNASPMTELVQKAAIASVGKENVST